MNFFKFKKLHFIITKTKAIDMSEGTKILHYNTLYSTEVMKKQMI